MSDGKVTGKQIRDYNMFLKEKSRPPSKGGNTNALHSHILSIDGERYSFLAVGSQQWVYKSDTVSFEYEVNNGYKNILKETLETVDANGILWSVEIEDSRRSSVLLMRVFLVAAGRDVISRSVPRLSR